MKDEYKFTWLSGEDDKVFDFVLVSEENKDS